MSKSIRHCQLHRALQRAKVSPFRRVLALSLGLSIAGFSPLALDSAKAATEYWDTGTAATTINGQVSGTWNTSTTNWETAATKIIWANANVAVFATNGATVGGGTGGTGGTGTSDATADSINVSLGISGLTASQLFFNNTGFVISAASAQTLLVQNAGTFSINVANGKSASLGNNATINLDSTNIAASNTVGVGGAAGGTFNIESGGTLSYFAGFTGGGGQFSFRTAADAVGESGTINVAGTLSFAATTPTSQISLAQTNGAITMNVNSGGLITSASTGAANNLGSLLLSNNGAAAILNINTGGTVTLSGTASTAGLDVARGASSTGAGTGTVNLNGGTLTTARSFSGTSLASNATATSTFNFNGGTLTADVTNNTDFMKGLTRANVRDGGAVIDTKTFNVTIGQALLHSNVAGNNPNTGAPDSATDGGLTKMSAGTLTLTGVNTYNGPTAINGGTLALSTGSLAGTAVTAGGASTNGTLQVNGGYTIGSSGSATLTLAANTGAVSLLDTTVNTLTINNATAGATAFTVGGGDTLSFDAGASTGDEINLGAGLLATATGSNTVNINVLARPAGTQTLTLINAPGGFTGSSDFTLGTVTGVVTSANSFGLMLALNSTANQLQLVETATAAPATAYFTGSLGASWNANNGTIGNFSTDSAGTVGVTQLPGATTDVHFYATNANTTNVAASTLDAAFTIKTLTVDGSTLGESNPVGIAPGTGGSLTITPTDPATGITVNSGAGAVTISAPVTLGAPQTWTNNSASLLAVSGAVTNGANTLTLAGSGNTTLSGVIGAGAGGLTMNGMGTLTLSAANTYTGATTITAGTVKNGVVNALPGGSALTVSGATYDLNGFADGVASLSDGGVSTGIVTNSSATAAAISTNGTASTTFSGLISGNLSFLQLGTSTLTISGANNTYTGGTTVGVANGNSVLLATATQALGSGAISILGNTATNKLELSGGISLNNPINQSSKQGTNGVGNAAGQAPSIENISGNNTLSGTITLQSGGGFSSIQSDAGLLTLSGSTAITIATSTRGVSFLGAGNTTVSGALTNGGGTLSVDTEGAGTVTFTGASTYTGTTTLNSGSTLQLGDGTTGDDGTIGNSSALIDNGTLIYDRFGTATAGYVISGTGAVTVSTGAGGAGVQTLTGGNTYMGATTINSGATLQLGNGTTGHDGTIANTSGVTDNGTLVYNRFGSYTAGYAVSGAGAVTVSGTGSQTFTGANTYMGATTISGGTLAAASTTGNALGSTASIAVNGGGTLLLSQPNQVNPTAVASTTAPAANVTLGVAATSVGNITAAANASQGSAATVSGGAMSTTTGTTVQGLGALTLNNSATLTFSGASTTLVFNTFTPNGNVLTISGYSNTNFNSSTGASGSGTDDRLVFYTDQTPNLGDFNFGAGAGVGVSEVALDSSNGNSFYEIGFTSVPEPATWLGGLLLVGAVGYSQRRRLLIG